MALLDCILATPDGSVFSGKARSIVVPAVDGELGILPRHAPLIGALGHGELRIEPESGEKRRYFVHSGFVQVIKNKVSVLVTTAEPVSAIDRSEAEKRVADLAAAAPAAGSPLAAREEHEAKLRVARARRRLAG